MASPFARGIGWNRHRTRHDGLDVNSWLDHTRFFRFLSSRMSETKTATMLGQSGSGDAI